MNKLPSHHSFACDCYFDIDGKAHPDSRCVALDAQVRDLKARLRVVRLEWSYRGKMRRAVMNAATDLRVKNWRKP